MSYSTPEWPPWIPCEDAGIAQSKLARIYLQIQGIPETCLCPQAAVLGPFPDENLCLNSVQLRKLHKTLQDYIGE